MSETGADQLLAEQAQILEQIVRGAPLRDVLTSLCRLAEAHAETRVRAAILIADEAGRRLHTGAAPSLPDDYNAAVDGIAIAADVGTCCAAAAMCKVVVTPDIATDPGWAGLKQLPLALGMVAAWSMPIMSAHNRVLGTFGTYFLEKREPTPHERKLVEVLSRTAALAIQRARSDRSLVEQARRAEFMTQLSATTQSLTEAPDVMATTARMLAEHLSVDRCAYAEVEDERVFVITGDYPRNGVPSIVGRWDVSAFGPACERAMREGVPYVVEDATVDPRLSPELLEAYRATTIRAVICVPLLKNGRFTAAMAVHQQTPRQWTPRDVELVSLVVARCWEALERSRVTRTLRESEARYRSMVCATPECVKLVAADGTLLQMNDAGLRMVEAEGRNVIGRSIYDAIAPEHRDAFRQFNERVCAGENATLTFDIVGLAGTRRAMESTAVALPAPEGGFHHLAITRDVSSRLAADRALAESRARLDYAVRLSGVGFWYCDLPFDELQWDARCKAHFFLPPDARVTIETFYERIQPDDRDATRAAIDASITNHESYDVVYRTVAPESGACKYIRALGGTAYTADGTPTRFDGVTVDVTAQKRDEERLARVASAALRIHSAGTLDGVIDIVTEEARDIIGARDCLATLEGDDGRPRRPLVRNATVLAVPFVARDGSQLGQIHLSNKDGGDFNTVDESVLVQLAQVAAIAIENARLYDQLREQDRRKDEFLATLAHELRNPLAPIRTGVQVLQKAPADQKKVLAMMDRQLDHLVHMVDDLLDISRITLGKVDLKKSLVDVRTVLDSALETTRPLVEAGGHEISLKLPSEALPLDVDPTRLSQVFANLINNAARYTPGGGRISIAVERSGEHLVTRISDTGIGIPVNMLPRVFDMFTQVGRTIERTQGGLGIGLTLVRRLVEMHGGTVEAHSEGAGTGSTFTVRLPLAMQASQANDVVHALAKPASTGLRIAVIDDNVDAAEMLAMLLEVGGHETRLAHSGRGALDVIAEFAPDVVFLDIGLPDMNGYEVAGHLRAKTDGPQPLLVALTGWGSDEDRRQAHAAGFDRHLVKPIDTAKLEDVLAAVRSSN